MKLLSRRFLPLLLSLSLLCTLAVPALASPALGDDLTTADTLLNQQTQLSTNVFWSTTYSDYRTENLITYTPNSQVTPLVTFGDVLTSRNTVSTMAKRLEESGYRVVAGINGDFYNVNNGLPIGLVVTNGKVRSSDGGYFAAGFRSDGTAVIGRPNLYMSADFGYGFYGEDGEYDSVYRRIMGLNKARTSAGIYLYTYEFNANHTTGNTAEGVDVICSIQEGALTIGGELKATVEQIVEGKGATAVGPNQIVLSANLEAEGMQVAALRNVPVGSTITIHITAEDPVWNDVACAIGALYSLVENGAVVSGLPGQAAPRTAIGQRADGTLVFYTIDGRRSGHSIGATMTQVANRLIELGCVKAIGLDGGGSTTLSVTKPTDFAAGRVNRPSDGAERSVSNQLFLVATNQPSGQLNHFYVSADYPYVLAGSAVNISAAAIDTNYIPMNWDYTLTASAGTLEGNQLITPLEGGDVVVTAEGGGSQGTATIHAISTPDAVAIRNSGGDIITDLTAAPGSVTQLTGSAAYKRLPLHADSRSFTWSLEGDIGEIDAEGRFTATNPGTGRITVSSGTQTYTIAVTVSNAALHTIEDFESEEHIFQGSGDGISLSINRAADYVQLGRGSAKLEYDLNNGSAVWNAGQPAVMQAPYTGLNLWVYGDGSNNSLSLLYSLDGEEVQSLPVAVLDFNGWKQISLQHLAHPMTIRGLEITGSGTGVLYLDQITATFNDTVDNDPPAINAHLNEEDWSVTGTVTDAVDGVLPKESVTLRYNGSPLGEYQPDSGKFTIALPGPDESHEAMRVTITAKDASGNIGRASVDIPALDAEPKFTDTGAHWAADYADFLYNANITTGYEDGSFRPNQNITRAQFAVMLYRYLKLDGSQYESVDLPFADLDAIPAYALPAIRALYTENIINGSTGQDGQIYFHPGNSLTRAQASAMIGRTQPKGYASAALTFSDAAEIPAYAEFYIRTMAAQGVISGYNDGTFRPSANITRGQMAKILYTLM